VTRAATGAQPTAQAEILLCVWLLPDAAAPLARELLAEKHRPSMRTTVGFAIRHLDKPALRLKMKPRPTGATQLATPRQTTTPVRAWHHSISNITTDNRSARRENPPVPVEGDLWGVKAWAIGTPLETYFVGSGKAAASAPVDGDGV